MSTSADESPTPTDPELRDVARPAVDGRAEEAPQRAGGPEADEAPDRLPVPVAPPERGGPIGEGALVAVARAEAGETCRNCGTPLAGPFCAACGQYARESARSIGTLFHDGWHVFTHLDGRLWRTLRLLVTKPGRLTSEYFAERRASYIPPFRLYFVISVLFFGLSSLVADPFEGPAVVVDTDTGALEESVERAAADAAAGEPVRRGATVTISTDDCDSVEFLGWTWAEEPLRAACRRHAASGGEAVSRAIAANLPKMMFVFLPLVAAVMLLLYWRPRRYYVEHLVFFLHTHAALFLAATVLVLLSAATTLASWLGIVTGLATAALVLYTPWYVYRGLRAYYGNGRALTLFKLSILGVAYFVFLLATFVFTVVYSVITT